jgi:hypothetical protein
VTEETFTKEIREALSNYDKFVVCIGKTVDECESTLTSLMRKAIHAFETRAPGLRHGIALDRHITIILSQSDSDRPHCGIYFNLHSPYQKQIAAAAARREQELTEQNKPDEQDEDDDDDFEIDTDEEDDDFEED